MAVVEGLAPVFLLIAVGFVCRQLGLLDERGVHGLNRVVANVALPALLLVKVGTAHLATSFSLATVAATHGATVGGALGALLLARVWGMPRQERGVFAQAAMRGNLAYVGFPVVLAMTGEVGLRQAAVTSALLIPVMNVLAVTALELSRPADERRAAAVHRVLLNPLVVAALASLALAALGWRPWSFLERTLAVLADLALPGALLALGAGLRVGRWRRVMVPAAAATAMKLAVVPAAGLWLVRWLGGGPLASQVTVLLLAAPTAVTSYSVAAELEGDLDLAGACVVWSTLGAVVAYVGWGLVL